MRIFHSSIGDTMLLDSPEGLHNLHAAINRFIGSSSLVASYPAISTGNPAPYSAFLLGLRIRKDETSRLEYADDGWLDLSGTVSDLSELLECFSEVNDGEHKHWYSNPVSLIIEADNSWPK